MDWSIEKVWNAQLSSIQAPAPARDFIRASEIGSPFLDRYYKMLGIPFSNEFDDRTLRVFSMGRLIEREILTIFKLAGIFQSTQEEIILPENQDHLTIKGHVDAVVGGKPDFEKAKKHIEKVIKMKELLEEDVDTEYRALNLVADLSKKFISGKYPDGLEFLIAEIKSVNSRAFWSHKNMDSRGYFKGYDHHKLQLLTYLLGHPTIKKGRLFYVSKDDLCVKEKNVVITASLKKAWLEDVSTMSNYIRNKQEPPKEEDVVWNNDKKVFEMNWRIGRSNYLTKITGLSKERWEKRAYKIAREKTLDYKWRDQASQHGINTDGMTLTDIKKECMKRNRDLKKIVIIREEDLNEEM
jgi:hypothetical protein